MENHKELGLCCHTMTCVFPNDKKFLSLYKLANKFDFYTGMKMHEGIYCFGGKNQKGEILNSLKILRIGEAPLKWTYAETKGT